MEKTFEIAGTTFTATPGEDCPVLVASLIAECERRNNADPSLVRLNKNTWVKKEKQP